MRTGDINALIEACIKDLSSKPEKLQNLVVKDKGEISRRYILGASSEANDDSDIFKHPGGVPPQLHRIRKGKTAPLQRQLSAPDVALRKLRSHLNFLNVLKYLCYGVYSVLPFWGPQYQATFIECFVFRWSPQCSKLGIIGNK